MLVSILFGACGVSLSVISCCAAVWAQACGLDHETSFVGSSGVIGSFGVLDRFLLLSVCWWEQYHDTPTSGTDYSDLRNRDNLVSRYCRLRAGVLVKAVPRYCHFWEIIWTLTTATTLSCVCW